RLGISSWLILEGLRRDLNRAFSIRLSKPEHWGSKGDGIRDAERKIAENLRLENSSSLILMGLTRNSNSRFAIRKWGLDSGRWTLERSRERHAETGFRVTVGAGSSC